MSNSSQEPPKKRESIDPNSSEKKREQLAKEEEDKKRRKKAEKQAKKDEEERKKRDKLEQKMRMKAKIIETESFPAKHTQRMTLKRRAALVQHSDPCLLFNVIKTNAYGKKQKRYVNFQFKFSPPKNIGN
jgi:ATPase subunit of ABC transporter with duplicated ATPase domains